MYDILICKYLEKPKAIEFHTGTEIWEFVPPRTGLNFATGMHYRRLVPPGTTRFHSSNERCIFVPAGSYKKYFTTENKGFLSFLIFLSCIHPLD
jgi:hypothetical protein